MTRLSTVADAGTLAVRAAAEIARQLRRAREQRGVAHLALSGGETPARTYGLLAGTLGEWDSVEVWFADERCVPPEHAESNYRLAADTLLRAARIPPGRVHRMEGELGPDAGARRYGEALRAQVRAAEHGLPVLDLVVLGIGPDGHVASLFPETPVLDASEQAICLAVHDSPKPPPERITLSLAMLRAARGCVLLAEGPTKAEAVGAMLAQPSRQVPASLLRRGRLTVIVDDTASPTPLSSHSEH